MDVHGNSIPSNNTAIISNLQTTWSVSLHGTCITRIMAGSLLQSIDDQCNFVTGDEQLSIGHCTLFNVLQSR